MIHTATFDRPDTNNIVVIPMLSGYRDRHSASFNVEHNYSAWYASHGIDLTSEPQSAIDFCKVLMLSEVESLLLYDPAHALVPGPWSTSVSHPQADKKKPPASGAG